jgi:hypothetical protein
MTTVFRVKESPTDVLSAYKDNASVIVGYDTMRFYPKADENGSVFNHLEQ